MDKGRVPIKLEIHDRTVDLSVEPIYAEVFRLMGVVNEACKRKKKVKAVAERVREVLASYKGVVSISVIPYAHLGGEYIVLVEAKSLGSSMDADYALEDAFGKQYTTYSKVDEVMVRVSVVDSEIHQQALRHSKLSEPV